MIEQLMVDLLANGFLDPGLNVIEIFGSIFVVYLNRSMNQPSRVLHRAVEYV